MTHHSPRRLAEERRQLCRLPSATSPAPLSSTEFLCQNIDRIRLTETMNIDRRIKQK
jgi:hypothetical protein